MMCREHIKVLSKVKSGELSLCKECKVYHLEFNNIYLELTQVEFDKFKDYVENIEIDYWEHKYACAKVRRKIPIPSMQPNLVLMFKRQEINELKALVNPVNTDVFGTSLYISDIDYTLILN
ncbi:hypothetical protein Q4566_09715 [Tamlana sp. 2_MG-2023]|uniref:DUF6686 family protein n=1 Tax=unclassified Tamlana TaxID=2614803 RepID=UPI0026E1A3E5|nr:MULTISPECIES: DUF6686 family protein [unclassified Tamlana]MDO6760473.1 hypothetical protein [Tamlana sp. 2_MG-2023]MDO6790729.1 hypothetical protein [Tamlana sp. 1_MG-2023]